MPKKSEYIMGEMVYKKAIWKLALPAIIGFLVLSMYMTVDRILIARFVGARALAAIQYFSAPAQLIVGITAVVAVGSKIRFSILFGQKKVEQTKEIIANGLKTMALVGIIVSSILIIWGKQMPYFFGATGDIAIMSGKYFYIFGFGLFAQSLVFFHETLFQAKGYMKSLMVFTIVSQLTNLVLDVVFMKYMNMGITGAALATVFAMWLELIMFIVWIIIKRREFIINPFNYKWLSESTKTIIKLGSPQLSKMFAVALKIGVMLMLISRIGSDDVVITYAAARTIIPIILIPAFGLITATGPMLSYNFGSKNYTRMKQIWSYKFKIMIIYFLTCSIIIMINPLPLMRIFNADTYEFSTFVPRVIVSTLWLIAYPLAWGSLFEATGSVKQTLILDLMRNIFIFLPVVLIASRFNNIKILLWALPLADILGILFTFIYIKIYMKKNKSEHFKLFR